MSRTAQKLLTVLHRRSLDSYILALLSGQSGFWLRLRETSGTTPANSGGTSGLTITWSPGAGAVGQTGRLGANEAYLYDGADSVITVTNAAGIQGLAEFSFWMLHRPASVGETGFGFFFHKAAEFQYGFAGAGRNVVAQIFYDGGTNALSTSTTALTANVWNTVGFRINNTTKKVDLFVNGQQAAYSGSQQAGVGSRVSNTNNVGVGNRLPGNDRTLDGPVDEAMLIGRALTDTEFALLHIACGMAVGGTTPWSAGGTNSVAFAEAEDHTAEIQAKLMAGIETIIGPGTYNIDAETSLKPPSGSTLTLQPGARLQAIPNAADAYAVVDISNKDYIAIRGDGVIAGERAEHVGLTGDGGHVVRIDGGRNLTLSGVRLENGWGDGLIIEGLTRQSQQITLSDVICQLNRRNGLSLTNVDGLTATDCNFSDNGGVSPQAGADLEPTDGYSVKNVHFVDTRFDDNGTYGVALSGAAALIDTVSFENGGANDNGAYGYHFDSAVNVIADGVEAAGNPTANYRVIRCTGIDLLNGEAGGAGVTDGINIERGNDDVTIDGFAANGHNSHGIFVQGPGGEPTTNVTVNGNTALGNGVKDIEVNPAVDIIAVTNNTTNKAIDIDPAVTNVTESGNVLVWPRDGAFVVGIALLARWWDTR